MTIYAKLAIIQDQVPILKKEGEMDMGNKKLAFLRVDDILAKIKPLFVANGVLVVPTLIEHHSDIKYGQEPPIEVKPETWSGRIPSKSIREKVVYDFTYIDVDDPESTLTVRTSGEAMDSQDKASNKAFTAAFKNALIKTFMIITGDPEIEDGPSPEPAAPKKTRGQQMTDRARPNGTGSSTTPKDPAPTDQPEGRPAKPSASTDPRPKVAAAAPVEDALSKAKARLRAIVEKTNVSKEEVDAMGEAVVGRTRAQWITRSTDINKIAKGLEDSAGSATAELGEPVEYTDETPF